MRIRVITAVWCVIATVTAAALALPASAQEVPPPDDEMRLAAAEWMPQRTPGPILTLDTPAALLDGLVPPPDAARTDALRALRTAGFVGGLARTHAAVPGRPAVLSWAVRGQASADAGVLVATIRRAVRARQGTVGFTDVALTGVAGGRLLGRVGRDGSQLTVAVFPAGPWVYGLQSATGSDGSSPDAAGLTAVAQQVAQRQPESAADGGAVVTPLEVDTAAHRRSHRGPRRRVARADRARARRHPWRARSRRRACPAPTSPLPDSPARGAGAVRPLSRGRVDLDR